MNKSKELETTTDIVKEILSEYPQARNSDDYLYYMVCKRKSDISISLPFWQVLLNRKQFGLPAFESVRRSRQKIQASYPELAGCDEVEGQRVLNEQTFRDYARGYV